MLETIRFVGRHDREKVELGKKSRMLEERGALSGLPLHVMGERSTISMRSMEE